MFSTPGLLLSADEAVRVAGKAARFRPLQPPEAAAAAAAGDQGLAQRQRQGRRRAQRGRKRKRPGQQQAASAAGGSHSQGAGSSTARLRRVETASRRWWSRLLVRGDSVVLVTLPQEAVPSGSSAAIPEDLPWHGLLVFKGAHCSVEARSLAGAQAGELAAALPPTLTMSRLVGARRAAAMLAQPIASSLELGQRQMAWLCPKSEDRATFSRSILAPLQTRHLAAQLALQPRDNPADRAPSVLLLPPGPLQARARGLAATTERPFSNDILMVLVGADHS